LPAAVVIRKIEKNETTVKKTVKHSSLVTLLSQVFVLYFIVVYESTQSFFTPPHWQKSPNVPSTFCTLLIPDVDQLFLYLRRHSLLLLCGQHASLTASISVPAEDTMW